MSNRLEEVRESLNFSKTEFCNKTGITYQSYQNYLNGRLISTEVLVKLKQLFNININWLLTGSGEMFENENNKPSEKEDIDITSKISEELTKLTDLQKEYYYHKIKSDALENEIRENVKGKQ